MLPFFISYYSLNVFAFLFFTQYQLSLFIWFPKPTAKQAKQRYNCNDWMQIYGRLQKFLNSTLIFPLILSFYSFFPLQNNPLSDLIHCYTYYTKHFFLLITEIEKQKEKKKRFIMESEKETKQKLMVIAVRRL